MNADTITKQKDPLGTKYLGGDWDMFVGQPEAKDLLITSARAAKVMKRPMDHTMIVSGVPGVGKTSLALLTAVELGAHVRVVSGVVRYADARLLLSDLDDGDVIVWEEVHAAVANGKKNVEWALHYLHDGMLVGPRGPEKVPQVTVLATTTDTALLPGPFLDRFTLLELARYSDGEGTQIAMRMAKDVLVSPLPEPTWDNCASVARAASNNPRLMRSIWQQVRNFALAKEAGNWHGLEAGYDLTWALDRLGLSQDGLTRTDRRYLTTLLTQFGAEPAGQRTLAEALQEPGGLRYTEQRLMDKELIQKGRSGRSLTTAGLRRAKRLLASEVGADG